MSPKVLNLILQLLDAHGEAVFGPEDVAAWPPGDFEEALADGLLVKAAPADEVVCPGCEDACLEDVVFIRGDGPEDTRAYVACGLRDDIARVQIPLETLDRWAVNPEQAEKLRPPRDPQTEDKPGGAVKRRKPKVTAAQNRMLLIHTLLAHHRSDTDTPNLEPASQAALAETLGWSQSTVSRTMEALLGESPMARYRRLCSQELLGGFLRRAEDGDMDVEAIDPHSLMQ